VIMIVVMITATGSACSFRHRLVHVLGGDNVTPIAALLAVDQLGLHSAVVNPQAREPT
jgi:hypothetical protein